MRFGLFILPFICLPLHVSSGNAESPIQTQPTSRSLFFEKEVSLPGGYKSIRDWLDLLSKASGTPWGIPRSIQETSPPDLSTKVRLQPFKGKIFQACLMIGRSCNLEPLWNDGIIAWIPPERFPHSLRHARSGEISLFCRLIKLDEASLLQRSGSLDLVDATLTALVRRIQSNFGVSVSISEKYQALQPNINLSCENCNLGDLLATIEATCGATATIQWGILWLDCKEPQEKTTADSEPLPGPAGATEKVEEKSPEGT